MQKSRVFVSQETLDKWLSDERVDVDGEVMTSKSDGRRYRLLTAVHFLREVADGGDLQKLVGKVKNLEQVTSLGGDHCSGSVVLGDDAYEVVDGFLGEAMNDVAPAKASDADGSNLASALGDASTQSGEFELFSQFYLRR